MKKIALVGILSAFSVLGIVSILAPARAANDGLPVGTIIAWGGPATSVPAGWVLCNGKALSKSAYAELFAAIGTSWGSIGDKFNLPDLRGRFLRGDDAGTGRDPDVQRRKPSNAGGSASGAGSVQEDSLQNHSHEQTPHSHESWTTSGSHAVGSGALDLSMGCFYDYWPTTRENAILLGAKSYGTKSAVRAGEESRPKNAAVNFIIKVK